MGSQLSQNGWQLVVQALFGTDTALASVAVLNMDDQGELPFAAAMAMMIAYTCAGARILHALLTRGITLRTQAWRTR